METANKQGADSAIMEGFTLVLDQFKSVLDRFNVKPITAVGEAFDPHYHEALTHMPSAEFAEGVCINEVRKGYLMGEKLLRAAQVVVSSGALRKERVTMAEKRDYYVFGCITFSITKKLKLIEDSYEISP